MTRVRRRLDTEMVRRGIAPSRSEAEAAIRSGQVTIAGRPAMKTATLVAPDEPIALTVRAGPFVSRAGQKLDAALDAFGIDVTGALALDAGASTGGFVDCLLARGAGHVVAVDVGYGQLDHRLRTDPRVTVMDRTNVRSLTPSSLAYRPDLLTADLSFISLRVVLAPLADIAAEDATFVLLVKPQFEAERAEIAPGGVVTEPQVWKRVLLEVAGTAASLGLAVRDVIASPLLGPAGNVEFCLHATLLRGVDRGQDLYRARLAAIDAAVRDGETLGASRG